MGQIGQAIGLVVDNFKVTNDHEDEVQLRVTFDFRQASDNDIKSWLCGNRRIAMQRPLRSLSVEELTELNDTTVNVNDCGKKVRSRAERIAAYVAAGIPEKLAEVAIDNPDKFQAIMDTVDMNEDETEE